MHVSSTPYQSIHDFYNDHLASIGIGTRVESPDELCTVTLQRAIRAGYNKQIVALWLKGRNRARDGLMQTARAS